MILTHGANSLNPKLKGLVYSTDFRDFDLETFIDVPQIGAPVEYVPFRTNGLSVGTVTVAGTVHNCLKFSGLYDDQINFPIQTLQGYDKYSLEMDIYVPSYGSNDTGGLEISGTSLLAVAPYFNTYTSNRGIGVKINNPSELYNGFNEYDGVIYRSAFYEAFDFSDIITGGFTVDTIDNSLSIYLLGKKAAKKTITNVNDVDIYFNNANVCVTGFRIYDYDRFDQME